MINSKPTIIPLSKRFYFFVVVVIKRNSFIKLSKLKAALLFNSLDSMRIHEYADCRLCKLAFICRDDTAGK